MYDLKLDVINECDGGFTQPSAVSGIRQDLFKKKVEEASIDKNSKDAGLQFRDLVENIQDTINDLIDISDWDNIPQKVQIKIIKFQKEFDRLKSKYNTSSRDIPIYKLWDKMTKDEQDNVLSLIANLDGLADKGLLIKKEYKRI